MMTQQPRAGTRLERVLARGVLTGRDRWLASVRRHPLLADAALAAVLLVLSVPPFTGLNGTRPALALALTAAIVLPLAWRRRAPFLVLMIITAAALVQLFTDQAITDYLAFLVAFYTVTAHAPPRRILAAAALLAAGTVLAVVRSPVTAAHAVWQWAILTGLAAAAGFMGYYVRTTRRAHLASLLDQAEQLERELEQQSQLAAAAERARIARELHDIVAHHIAVMIALAEGAACTAASRPGQAVTLMGEVAATGRSALTEMRRLLGVLREPTEPAPGHTPQPTLADLDDLLATVRAAGLPVRLAVTGQQFPLQPGAQLAAYRVIQESLTNALKHAPGTSALVHLSYLPGELRLDVTNDGHPGAGAGSGQPIGVRAAGHGIAGMRERAAVFGGEVSAGPRPGGGWRVHLLLPAGPAPAGGDRATAAEGA
jgi:signal transduction histidine kinase